nr:hypothetical protein [Microbacterium hominis]
MVEMIAQSERGCDLFDRTPGLAPKIRAPQLEAQCNILSHSQRPVDYFPLRAPPNLCALDANAYGTLSWGQKTAKHVE